MRYISVWSAATWLALASLGGCHNGKAQSPSPSPLPAAKRWKQEGRFSALRQLTRSGENAEAYWSSDGRELIFQARPAGDGCDQIYRMSTEGNRNNPPKRRLVSTGKGVTTCSFFSNGNQEILYASTHHHSPACPPKPDRSQGYVWPLYPSYDIFLAKRDGTQLRQLTKTPGYDAEATVCSKDGSIVFTSLRDGDLDLYRMDADGKNLKRLTSTPGYDGGAFFSADCRSIVWRASRPKGKALIDYKRLLKQNLVRPGKLELYVANADGSHARQVTYLNAAAFGPYFFPGAKRIIFSSNHGSKGGREFDMWAVNVDGTQLEQITFAPGFDGFPMFSPDGTKLAFSSNRSTPKGRYDTNVFIADWRPKLQRENLFINDVDRVQADASWLAAAQQEGRGVGSKGIERAANYIAQRFKKLGADAGQNDGYQQKFQVVVGAAVGPGNWLQINGQRVDKQDHMPLAFSKTGEARGELVFANYGISSKKHRLDDYAKVDARGKFVLVRRFVPDKQIADKQDKQRLSDLRYKAWNARRHGAIGLLVADIPKAALAPVEAPWPHIQPEGYGDAGIPVAHIKRKLASKLINNSRARKTIIDIHVDIVKTKKTSSNIVARLPANAATKRDGAIVLGAHYDHLGRGPHGSLAPHSKAIHFGADDNASGVAVLLELAKQLRKKNRQRDIWFVAFSGEERGLLGSTHFVRNKPSALQKIVAMLNFDMVGRMRNNTVQVLGGQSASDWARWVEPACASQRIRCLLSGGGYGPSDQTPFYAAGSPVLHFFTGSHGDYHKPSDTADKLNAAGMAAIARTAVKLSMALSTSGPSPSYKKGAAPAPSGDARSHGASLGTIPDYGAGDSTKPGMLVAAVRPGGPAEIGGIKGGDRLVKLADFEVRGVRDLMFALRRLLPKQTVTATVMRDGKKLQLRVTLQASRRRHR